MATILSTILSASAAAVRVAVLVLMMIGPVMAVTMLKAGSAPKISGAGLVLLVSLERSA